MGNLGEEQLGMNENGCDLAIIPPLISLDCSLGKEKVEAVRNGSSKTAIGGEHNMFDEMPKSNCTVYSIDPEYLEFLEILAKPIENLPSAEIQLERSEVERAVGVAKDAPIVTPLMDSFVKKDLRKMDLGFLNIRWRTGILTT